MCGILFYKSEKKIGVGLFEQALSAQAWRGPDAQKVVVGKHFELLGHVRLSIQDPQERSNQPLFSASGRYCVIFNGEIYNHFELRRRYGIECKTGCDTETLVEGFEKFGFAFFEQLEGMFALVIIDTLTGDWWATRDGFGIKPLFLYNVDGIILLSSETISIRKIVECSVSNDSLQEWKSFRRPIPGMSFFNQIEEVLPGTILMNGKKISQIEPFLRSDESYSDIELWNIMRDSVADHELSDVENVSLLSGGIDSSLIFSLSSTNKAYSTGLEHQNEIFAAEETAAMLAKSCVGVPVKHSELVDSWRHLLSIRSEPLSVPNEGLIYLVCKAMKPSEKVVLTGEGADEVFFGYDRIFRWAQKQNEGCHPNDFFSNYNYSSGTKPTQRSLDYLSDLARGKTGIDFVEDFFLKLHMPGLLRRMDGASMAASKEARVPFVSKKLVQYLYRRPSALKMDSSHAKLPLRRMISKLKLDTVLKRQKIGFSARSDMFVSADQEYKYFQKFNLECLGWL